MVCCDREIGGLAEGQVWAGLARSKVRLARLPVVCDDNRIKSRRDRETGELALMERAAQAFELGEL